MQIPPTVELTIQIREILLKKLLCVEPEEGCALLLGNKAINCEKLNLPEVIKIELIWPCSNEWEQMSSVFEQNYKRDEDRPTEKTSKKNRFAISPIDQIKAQKWARKRNLSVIGTAHSHPNGLAIPSTTDKIYNLNEDLMLIVGIKNEIRAWQIQNDSQKKPVELKLLSNIKTSYV